MTQGGLGERRKDSDSEMLAGVDIRGLWSEATDKNPCYEPLRLCIQGRLEWNEVEMAGGMFGAEALSQCVSLWGPSLQRDSVTTERSIQRRLCWDFFQFNQ